MSSKWRSAAIGELCAAVFSGGTPTSTNPEYFGGSIPWLRTKEVNYTKISSTEEHISQAGYENSSAKLVPINSVIVAMYGNGDTAGRVAINKIPLTTNQACCNLVVDPGRADYRFVYYVLKGRYQELVDLKNGGAQQNLNARLIRAFPITVPSLSTQSEIADFLECLDDRITLLRETNATLEAIAQALFKSWFIDFDPVRAKQKGLTPVGMDEATAALFPDGFEGSAFGPRPRGWITRRVEEIAARIGMGPFGSNIKVSTFVDQGIPVLNGANVQGALLEDGDFRFISVEHAQRLRNSCVHAGDIVLTHRGTLGQVALLPSRSRFEEYVLSQSQFFVRCDPRVVEPEWMLYFLRSPGGQHLLLANASQVGVPSIARPSTYLRSMTLVLPPSELLSRFAEVARAIHDAIVGNRGRVGTLATLRDTILPRLVSGQLRLPEEA